MGSETTGKVVRPAVGTLYPCGRVLSTHVHLPVSDSFLAGSPAFHFTPHPLLGLRTHHDAAALGARLALVILHVELVPVGTLDLDLRHRCIPPVSGSPEVAVPFPRCHVRCGRSPTRGSS